MQVPVFPMFCCHEQTLMTPKSSMVGFLERYQTTDEVDIRELYLQPQNALKPRYIYSGHQLVQNCRKR